MRVSFRPVEMLRFCPFSLRIMEKAVEVRPATREDCSEIRQLIQELADFEEMPNSPKIDYQVLEKDGFDTAKPLFKCFVAVCEDKVIGYALYFDVYTTLDRKAVHLEDLYVSPNFRKKHVGSRLFDSVARRTFEEKCQYLDFSVLSWNPAQGFYKAKGAVNLSEAEGWHAYRLNHESLLDLATKFSGRNREQLYVVRQATSEDCDSIRRLAEDGLPTQNVRISKYKKPKLNEISVIDVRDESCRIEQSGGGDDDYYGYYVLESVEKKQVIGYALYCYSYSTWEGRSMYLQELYVSPAEQHSANMKLDLLSAVAQRACEKGCCRLDFWLLALPNAAELYLANGAVDLTESEEWNMYRLFEMTKKPA